MPLLIILLLAGLAVGTSVLVHAWFVAPYQGRVRRDTLELDDLPPGLDGLTILHLSDLHLTRGDHRRARLIRQVTDVEADIVAVTGDFIETDEDVDFCTETLSSLRGRYGVFAVLGNHDYAGDRNLVDALLKRRRDQNDVGRLIRKLEASGLKVLMNENHRVRIDGQELWVVGVNDPYQRRHDLKSALAGVPRSAYKLLLAHSPDVVDQLRGRRVNLILCGHTHGGQVVFPLVGALMTRTRHPLHPASGWRKVGQAWMNVSRGIGGSLPIRFRCPPEANLVQLKARPKVSPYEAVHSEARQPQG